MTRDTVNCLAKEAVSKLEAYLKTGLAGYRQQGLDRAKAIGINIDGCLDGRDGARRLIECLTMYWID